MARRAPAVSITPLTSPSTSSKSLHDSVQSPLPSIESQTNGYGPWTRPRSASVRVLDNSVDAADPDELFTKFPVAEVKAIQNRLRANAIAKQEDLRQMVGERYRDLLQASTSIISISESSRRVLRALEDMKDAIPAKEQMLLPDPPALARKDDAHLQTLQSLSTHMKLLLDAPEHIWRLLEKKQYFQAAWLFLLARVVQRALLHDDADSEEGWESHGIDVAEQFPLVQRQWDTVSQFRSQITHKAILSLRDHLASSEDVCATVLTLHFLDSQPMVDTLFTLLGQRSKTLYGMLSIGITDKQSNGYGYGNTPNGVDVRSKARKIAVREVRQKIRSALDVVSRTMMTAREIFLEEAENQSLVRRALGFIQSDNPSLFADILPTELQLTTLVLLTSLPSSSHFLVLPPNIKSYKPYVDLSSLSSQIHPLPFRDHTKDWFYGSIDWCRPVFEKWLLHLEDIREVWKVRTTLRKWINATSELEDKEKILVRTVLDNLYRKRVSSIWKSVLTAVDSEFRDQLLSVLTMPGNNWDDLSPLNTVFAVPPVPTHFQTSSPDIASFHRYKSAVRHQISGRSSLLDQVLDGVESHAINLRESLEAMEEDEADTRGLVETLTDEYRHDAESSCSKMADVLRSALEDLPDDTDVSLHKIIFVGQIADFLSSSSHFLSNIGCSPDATDAFRFQMRALYMRSIDRWRKRTVHLVVQLYWQSFAIERSEDLRRMSDTPLRPSSALMQCLFTLSTSVQKLGLPRQSSAKERPGDETLRTFITDLLKSSDDERLEWHLKQHVWDLLYLRKIAELHGDEWTDISSSITARILGMAEKTSSYPLSTLEDLVSDYLSRTQLMLDPLLPPLPHSVAAKMADKTTALLHFGSPSTEPHFQPTMELVKPSSRFGLLLVENTAMR